MLHICHIISHSKTCTICVNCIDIINSQYPFQYGLVDFKGWVIHLQRYCRAVSAKASCCDAYQYQTDPWSSLALQELHSKAQVQKLQHMTCMHLTNLSGRITLLPQTQSGESIW